MKTIGQVSERQPLLSSVTYICKLNDNLSDERDYDTFNVIGKFELRTFIF